PPEHDGWLPNQKVAHQCGNHHKGTEPADRRRVPAHCTVALRTQANSIANAEPPTPACRLSFMFLKSVPTCGEDCCATAKKRLRRIGLLAARYEPVGKRTRQIGRCMEPADAIRRIDPGSAALFRHDDERNRHPP